VSTKPTKLPRWATALGTPAASAYVTEPPDAKKTSGWLPGDAVPSGWLDWLLFYAYSWLWYLDAGKDKDDGYGYNAADPPKFSTTIAFGGTTFDDAAVGGAVPLQHKSGFLLLSGTAATLAAGQAWHPFDGWNNDDTACVTLTSVSIEYIRVAAGDTLDIQLLAVKADASSSTTVAHFTNADLPTGASHQTATKAISHSIAAAEALVWKVQITPTAAITGAMLELGKIDYTKTRVE